MDKSALFPEFAARVMQMKKAGVLRDIEASKIDASNGVIVCACGDCDQERNYTPYLANILSQRLHRIHVNGGPISMPAASPLHSVTDEEGNQIRQGVAVRLQLRDSVKLKSIKAVPFVAHVPCGAAMLGSMSIDDLIRALVTAKRDFTNRYGESLGVKVPCLVHVDWTAIAPELKKPARTYYVSADAAETWLAIAPAPRPLSEVVAQAA